MTTRDLDMFFLIKEKSSALELFKIYKAEVENQLDLKIKVVRSDRGREFYGRFDEIRRNPGPFARFLQQEGIIAQYTNPGTPQQNGIAYGRNRTPKDVIRSMMCCTNLPIFLWGEALKTENYILNRVPTKSINNIPYEVLNKRKPRLKHLKIWSYKAEAKLYNPMEKKLDSRIKLRGAVFIESESESIEDENFEFDEGIEETGETMQTDILVLPSFDLNGNQNNQEGQIGIDPMVIEEETHKNKVLLPENQHTVQTQEGTNNKTNARLRRSERPKKCTLHDDYYVYLQDSEHDVNDIEDPMNFKQAMMSDKNENWWATMKS
ncbi:hypothetical protein L3X38_034263 [Prunus dulcis]|uniref:Integrase catalytic domain-containing protein n=1 Tax=Prunus dulcis TaxID=3755 RepID=A0AAD4VIX6_PRUDU|nr:hypothetical protein L3X38_034263 [Prunus dulcis]